MARIRARGLAPAHHRHDHVQDHQADGRVLAAEQVDRLLPVGGQQDSVAQAAEHVQVGGPEQFLVIPPPGSCRCREPGRSRAPRRPRRGRPAGGPGTGTPPPPGFPPRWNRGGPARSRRRAREAQAGALAGRLGGEERLEHPGQDLRRHAAAGVFDLHLQVAAGTEPERAGGAGPGVQVDGGQAERQGAAPGHGVAGVDAQVHEQVGQLGTVATDPGGPGLVGQGEADLLVQGPLQERHRIPEHPAQLQGPERLLALAGGRQELGGEVPRPGPRRSGSCPGSGSVPRGRCGCP